MRVAAGVLLIFAAVINLFAGIFFLGGGAAVGSMSKLTAMAEQAEKKKGHELTDDQKEQFAQANEAQRQAERDPKVRKVVSAVMGYGSILLVTVGTCIAGAVCLFRRRAVTFIVISAAVLLLAEVGGCVAAAVVIGRGVLVTKLLFSSLGILAGIFALVGARQVSVMNAQPVDPPMPVAAPI